MPKLLRIRLGPAGSRLLRSWRQALALQRAWAHATGQKARGTAASMLTSALSNYRRLLRLRLLGLGVNPGEVLRDVGQRPDAPPFAGVPDRPRNVR